jgi:hypothetical protein
VIGWICDCRCICVGESVEILKLKFKIYKWEIVRWRKKRRRERKKKDGQKNEEKEHGRKSEVKEGFTSGDKRNIEREGDMKISWRKESVVMKRGWFSGLLS